MYPGTPFTIKTMDVNITTITYLRVLIIGIGSTIILMVAEAQGVYVHTNPWPPSKRCATAWLSVPPKPKRWPFDEQVRQAHRR